MIDTSGTPAWQLAAERVGTAAPATARGPASPAAGGTAADWLGTLRPDGGTIHGEPLSAVPADVDETAARVLARLGGG